MASDPVFEPTRVIPAIICCGPPDPSIVDAVVPWPPARKRRSQCRIYVAQSVLPWPHIPVTALYFRGIFPVLEVVLVTSVNLTFVTTQNQTLLACR